jgi:hypothetical protein
MTENMIAKLEALGFKRWQKGSFDRLYINASDLGLVCSYYNTGNIRSAEFQGEHISNCSARKLKFAKTFIDVKSGRLYSDHDWLRDAAQELIEQAAA